MAILEVDQFQLPCLTLENGFQVRLELDNLDKVDQAKALRELRETPENVKIGLAELRKLILEDDELYMPIEEEFLMPFLRSCKFYAVSAHRLIQKFFRYRAENRNFYSRDLTAKGIKDYFLFGAIHVAPRRDQHRRRLIVIQSGEKWDLSKAKVEDLIRAVQVLVLGGALEPSTQVNGVIVIMDFNGWTFSHSRAVTFEFIRTLLFYLENCLPLRLKAIHFVSSNYVIKALVRIFKPFMFEKLRKRFYIHGNDYRTLHEHIDPSHLPASLGGTSDIDFVDPAIFYQLLESYEEEFELFQKFGYHKYKPEGKVYDGQFYAVTPKVKTFMEIRKMAQIH